jgi:type I restriction enzyme S subunit
MNSHWISCTISDLGTVVGGSTPSTKVSENYTDGKIPWITPKDLAGYNHRYISRGERNITEQGFKSSSLQMLPQHSVLFTSRAPIGYIAIAENDLCTNQGFKSVVPNSETDYMFLYYLLKFNKENIENMGSGTTFKEVSGTTMRNIPVFVPEDKQTQQRIASVLSALDSKIEQNTAINNNLHPANDNAAVQLKEAA